MNENVKKWAEKLDGREYGNELTSNEITELEASGLVVVFGASDDLCEFSGAIDDEVGCFDGGDIYVNAEGLIANNMDMFDSFIPEKSPDYVHIKACWDCDGYSWSYETDIPHESFEIFDDGDPYCRGIVFSIADMPKEGGECKMNKTKIEWCDSTWNPVTGCLHGCEYCYARKMVCRFSGCIFDRDKFTQNFGSYEVITEMRKKSQKSNIVAAPYPFGFEPTLHRYKLDVPQNWTKPRTIFVCSMADLFGEWVPDEWIEEVFKACEKAPQHRYLFLTKNPFRYEILHQKRILRKQNNMWYGYSATKKGCDYWCDSQYNVFASIEPILEKVYLPAAKWIIIGAETGSRKDKVVPQKEWIDNICESADVAQIPVFMKDSLIPIVGEENMRREFPW